MHLRIDDGHVEFLGGQMDEPGQEELVAVFRGHYPCALEALQLPALTELESRRERYGLGLAESFCGHQLLERRVAHACYAVAELGIERPGELHDVDPVDASAQHNGDEVGVSERGGPVTLELLPRHVALGHALVKGPAVGGALLVGRRVGPVRPDVAVEVVEGGLCHT